MDLPLQKIKEVLEYDDLEKIIDFLRLAEKMADDKMTSLQYSKSKIQLAKANYESKLSEQHHTDGVIIKHLPKRVILLSDTLETPTLDNLWSYLTHFYDKLPQLHKEQFAFEDMAGIYTENGMSRLFAVCTRYADMDGIRILPAGNYLCADCTEENRAYMLDELLYIADSEHHVQPKFITQQIVVSGILQWNYQVQIFL